MTKEEKYILARYHYQNETYNETDWVGRVDWELISQHPFLSEKFMGRHADRLDWRDIFRYQKLSEKFMEKHIRYIHWQVASCYQYFSEKFMEKHIRSIHWPTASSCQSISESLMRKNAGRINWGEASRFQVLSESLMRDFAEHLDWWYISYYQNLSEEFMEEFAERIQWYGISSNQSLSEPFMEKHAERLDWRKISRQQILSEPFIAKFEERFPKDFRDNNWLYADRETKLRHIREKAPEFVVQEDAGGPFIVAWKSTKWGGRSSFNSGIRYEVGGIYETRCDHDLREHDSFGLSAWTEEGAKRFINNGELYRVKIYVDDIGAMVYDGKKIRCRKQEFLEMVA